MSDARSEPYLHGDATRNDAAAPAPAPATPPRATRGQRSGTRWRAILLALLAVLAVAALVSIFRQPGDRTAALPARPAAAPQAPAASAALHPLASTPAELPTLDASDAAILGALAAVFGDGSLLSYVERERVVRRIVATVDNLPRRSAPPAHWPVKPAPGTLATATGGGRTTIAAANGQRYMPYVRLLESLDTKGFVEFYRRHYPLFQQAYRELGYPDGHFNDRAVEVIDVLIATPTLAEQMRLTQPKVFLEFADRELEALPAGQKAMLRIGSANAARVKAKLAELRAAITDPAVAATR
jgi:hypothetical protein